MMARRTSKPRTETPQLLEAPPHPAAFIGRWELVNDKGAVEMYLTVTKSGAKKKHAPKSPGTWVVVGKEARFIWEDGSRDIMRLEDDGSMTLLQLGKNARRWDARPKSRLYQDT